MAKILIVDHESIIREPITALLQRSGYDAVGAATAHQAMSALRGHPYDLLILDVFLSDKSGLDLLDEIRADAALAQLPVILLSASRDKQTVVRAANAGVSDYLLKSCFSLSALLDRVAKRLAPAASSGSAAIPSQAAVVRSPATSAADPPVSLQAVSRARPPVASGPMKPLLTRDACISRAETAIEGKTLSGVVAQVISLASSPRMEMSQLATLIGRDGMLTMKVLRAANSAVYSSAGALVTTVPEAIRKLGCTTVRNVAAALGVFEVMPATASDGFNPIRCWQHSFAVAKICEELTRAQEPEQAGLAYMIGLCHDLAEFFVYSLFDADYQQVNDEAKRAGRPVVDVQKEMLGITHSELSRHVLKCIGMPDAIREPINMLHSPARHRAKQPLARILWFAENYANGTLLASGPGSEVAPLSRADCMGALGHPEPTRLDGMALRAEVVSLTAMLARLPAQEEAKLMEPIFPSQAGRIWLARDERFSGFDPIELALSSLANVEVHTALPPAEALATVDGLAVIRLNDSAEGMAPDAVTRFADRWAAARGGSLPVLTFSAADGSGNSGAEKHARTLRLLDLAALASAASAGPRMAQAA